MFKLCIIHITLLPAPYSWAGDNNNCWDYCFGKEEELSTSLVNIIQSQNFDGIVSIDYLI